MPKRFLRKLAFPLLYSLPLYLSGLVAAAAPDELLTGRTVTFAGQGREWRAG